MRLLGRWKPSLMRLQELASEASDNISALSHLMLLPTIRKHLDKCLHASNGPGTLLAVLCTQNQGF